MKPRNQVRVRSSETGREFNISRRVAERHDTLTILDDGPVVETSPAESDEIPAAGTKADQFAAPVADDDEKE